MSHNPRDGGVREIDQKGQPEARSALGQVSETEPDQDPRAQYNQQDLDGLIPVADSGTPACSAGVETGQPSHEGVG